MIRDETKFITRGKIKMKNTEKKLNPTAEKVLNFLMENRGKAFTAAEIGKALNIEFKSTGSITRLLKSEKNPSGIIEHGDKKDVQVVVTRKVNTYMIKNTEDENA